MESTQQPINERFRGYLPVIVDIETAGFNPKKNPLLEIAAVIVEFDELGRAKALLKSEKWKDMQQHRRANSDPEYGSFMLIEGGDTIAK